MADPVLPDWRSERVMLDFRELGPEARRHLVRVLEGRIQTLRDLLEQGDSAEVRGAIREHRQMLNQLEPTSAPAPQEFDRQLADGY